MGPVEQNPVINELHNSFMELRNSVWTPYFQYNILLHSPDCFTVSTLCIYTDLGSREYFAVWRRSRIECQIDRESSLVHIMSWRRAAKSQYLDDGLVW